MGAKSAQLDGQQCVPLPLTRTTSPPSRAPPVAFADPSLLHGRQQAAYLSALQTSADYFRALLSSSSSKAWKPLAVPASNTNIGQTPPSSSSFANPAPPTLGSRKGKEPASSSSSLDASNVIVHRRSGKTGEVYRATLELPLGQDGRGLDGRRTGREEFSTEGFRAVLATSEIRTLCE